jgi:formiminoglutamate deiminase
VEFLLGDLGADARWCIVHATHMTAEETRALAKSGAVAGLCPITEANLGDGPFNGAAYLDAGGAFGVGTDSNVRISMTEELRTLEYSQRLKHLMRIVLAGPSSRVGETLYLGAAHGGAKALARNAGQIETGLLADLVAIDSNAPSLCSLEEDQILDGLAFAAGGDIITDVWSAGRYVVRSGRHHARDSIVSDYRKTIAGLSSSLNE